MPKTPFQLVEGAAKYVGRGIKSGAKGVKNKVRRYVSNLPKEDKMTRYIKDRDTRMMRENGFTPESYEAMMRKK